jgi:hypothetical protein
MSEFQGWEKTFSIFQVPFPFAIGTETAKSPRAAEYAKILEPMNDVQTVVECRAILHSRAAQFFARKGTVRLSLLISSSRTLRPLASWRSDEKWKMTNGK